MIELIIIVFQAFFWFIIIASIVRNVKKGPGKAANKAGRTYAPAQQAGAQPQAPRMQPQAPRTQPQAPRTQPPQPRSTPSSERRRMTPEEKRKLEQMRAARDAKAPAPQASTKPPILEKASSNAAKYSANQTMEELEREHNHIEHNEPIRQTSSSPLYEDGGSLLGSVEDLMVKGYDGNLSFERDFVGEALDMISRIQVTPDI